MLPLHARLCIPVASIYYRTECPSNEPRNKQFEAEMSPNERTQFSASERQKTNFIIHNSPHDLYTKRKRCLGAVKRTQNHVIWVRNEPAVKRGNLHIKRVMFGIVFPTERVGTGLFGADFGRSKGPDERYCMENDTYSNKNAGKPFRGRQMGKEIRICENVVEYYFFTDCHQFRKQL